MENKYSFYKQYRPLIFLGPVLSIVILVIEVLYDLNIEFVFYFISFILLSWVIVLALQFRIYKEIYNNKKEAEIVDTSKEDFKWKIVKEKEDFFAMWAHQIKTPIAALNLLLQSEEPDYKECRQETIKIESYVDMALNYLRFDNMSNDLVLEPVELEGLLKQAVKKQSTVFIYKHLSIKLENVDYRILTDDKWFSFIIDQVLSNALKYTKTGGITIYGEILEEELTIKIQDTGIGIRSEDIPRLFSKGFTGYNGRMDKKASGLGLYLCKGVSDKLGHEMSIESTQGVGTTVSIKVKVDKIKKSDLTKM